MSKSSPDLRPLVVSILLYGVVAGFPATAEIIPFDSDRWVIYNGEIVEHLGRQSLIGSAYLPNIGFENGIIEFDVVTDGRRGYPGIRFRVQSQIDCEKFYFRPHVPDRPDALQYTADVQPGSRLAALQWARVHRGGAHPQGGMDPRQDRNQGPAGAGVFRRW